MRRQRDHIGARPAPSAKYVEVDPPRARLSPLARRPARLKDKLDGRLLQISAALLVAGAAGWCWLIYNELRSPGLVTPAMATFATTAQSDPDIGKSLSFGTSSYRRIDNPRVSGPAIDGFAGYENAAAIVAREWSLFAPRHLAESRVTDAPRSLKEDRLKPAIRLASLEAAPLSLAARRSAIEAVPSQGRPAFGPHTALVDFETAPFPYHGLVPGSNRPFLNVGEEGRRGHTNFRGHIFWESQTFSDDRVLLHVPPGFDPSRPAVIVVFFHGHGANLARDVRDRQRLPAQITAAGVNAVLVAPQFAVDAADSSSGNFWQPNGFKRFLDEAAVKLARLYGDPRRAAAFAKMPVVIVAYSGGFGPTLSVLERGGVRSRVRGVVLLDALYAGIDKFADWIASNRSAFFISAFTPHTAQHNADLEHLLSERSVPYGSELRNGHLQGMVTFLPTGDISHRNFVTRAWTQFPVTDILARMNGADSNIQTARAAPLR